MIFFFLLLSTIVGGSSDMVSANQNQSLDKSAVQRHCRRGEAAALAPLLRQHGAEIFAARLSTFGWTCLHWAVWCGRKELVVFLLHAGDDPNRRDDRQQTPLIVAADIGRAEEMAVLLTAGAQIDAASDDGETALRLAIRRLKTACVATLIGAGADLEKAKSGSTHEQAWFDAGMEDEGVRRAINDGKATARARGSQE